MRIRFTNLRSIFFCIATVALLSSCTTDRGTAKVTITIPDFAAPRSSNKTLMSDRTVFSQNISSQSFGQTDPTSLTEFDCFAVFVGADEPGLKERYCPVGATGASFRFGPARGLIPRGGTLTIDVPPGLKRSVYIVGLAIAGGNTCESFSEMNSELNQTIYSNPFLLGAATKDLAPGLQQMTINVAFDSNKKIGDCDFKNGSGGGGGGGGNQFGTGVDGDQTVTINGSELNLTNFAYTDTLGNIRKFTAIERVTGISPSGANYNLNLAGAPNLQQFRSGDDVLLYLAAGSTSGCGNSADASNSLWPGFKVPGKVMAFAGGGSNIQVAFTEPRLVNLSSGNLSAAASSVTSFCRAVLVRVPNFKNLTFDYQTNHYASVPGFGPLTGSNHNGGVLAFKVQEVLTTPSNSTAGLSVWGKGFSGVPSGVAGNSATGFVGTPATANNNSGGGGSTAPGVYPGGGGHGGDGGAGNTGGAAGFTIGDAYGCGSYDASERCLFGKMFLGGAGGTYFNTASASNSGGGLVSISAKKLLVPGGTSFMIMANGKGGTTEDGAGAGGSVLIESAEIDIQGNLNFFANGGETNGFGGSGGGGRIHLNVTQSCTTAGAGNLNFQTYGGAVYGSGLAGSAGTRLITGSALSQPSCFFPAF